MGIRFKENLAQKRFGSLLVIGVAKKKFEKYGNSSWACLCDCGNITIKSTTQLNKNKHSSCGCVTSNIRHGENKTKLHRIWMTMRERTTRKKCQSYKHYGGRGIKVCEEWQTYENFRDWALSSGYEEGLSIERVDNDGDYCPENCVWADRYTQANNKRTNVKITLDGQTKTMSEWARDYGICYKLVHARINKLGQSPEKAIKTPVHKRKSKYKGVFWDKSLNKWRAWVRKNNKTYYVKGTYIDEIDAKIARDNFIKDNGLEK